MSKIHELSARWLSQSVSERVLSCSCEYYENEGDWPREMNVGWTKL